MKCCCHPSKSHATNTGQKHGSEAHKAFGDLAKNWVNGVPAMQGAGCICFTWRLILHKAFQGAAPTCGHPVLPACCVTGCQVQRSEPRCSLETDYVCADKLGSSSFYCSRRCCWRLWGLSVHFGTDCSIRPTAPWATAREMCLEG